MKKIVSVFIVLGIASFSTSCASIYTRIDDPHHESGTLYPGTRHYVSEFPPMPGSSMSELWGPELEACIFCVGLPISIVDVVLSTVYDTIALPYDCIQAVRSRDNPTKASRPDGYLEQKRKEQPYLTLEDRRRLRDARVKQKEESNKSIQATPEGAPD